MRTRLLAGSLAAALLPSAGAIAAPQMLGLVATDRPAPFACEGDLCTTELTAFCLEERREPPLAGRHYRAVDAGKLTLVVTGPDGRKRMIPAKGLVRFVSTRRGVAAVRVEIERSALTRLGAQHLGIRVSADASLAPLPRSGDKTPHSAREIAHIAGPMRSLGTRLVDRSGPRIVAARSINRAINRLPRKGRADAAQRHGAWADAIAASTRSGASRLASQRFRMCARWTANPHTPFTLRSCLEEEHKLLMSALNKRYWKASRPGM